MKKFLIRCFNALLYRGKLKWLPDKPFICLLYLTRMGQFPNLRNPKTYNEKLQWLKLHDRNPAYVPMVDKLKAKELVAQKIGSEYIIPTIRIWDSPQEICFDELPNQFVLKCNHNSGGVVVCRNKSELDQAKALAKLSRAFRENFFYRGREWPYKNIEKKVFAEVYMEDKATSELRDYKFFVFDGKVKALFVACGRIKSIKELRFDFFDENYQHLEVQRHYPKAAVPPQKPVNFEEMKRLAETLGKDLPHVRIDFYEVDGKVYFGEYTFFSGSGIVPFEPECWDEIFGSWLKLPKQTNE